MAIPADLKTATEQNLLELISAEVREGKVIEYKRELTVDTSEQKRKFVSSVVSFANASGGEIIYGMQAKDGKPIQLHPLSGFDPDKTTLQLRDLLRAHVEPLLMGIEFQPVAMVGGWALIIRASRSWNPPHMVKLDDNHFWARNEGGRVMMTVPEIRDALLGSKGLAQRIQLYRAERLLAIRSREIPVKTEMEWKAVFHILPFLSFTEERFLDLTTFKSEDLRPFVVESGYGLTYDVDGIYCQEKLPDGSCLAYTFVSRTGCIEASTSVDLRLHEGRKFIMNPRFERHFIEFMPHCRKWLQMLGAEPPFVIAISLLEVRGFLFATGSNRPLRQREIQQRDLLLPAVIMKSLTEENATVLKPIFDALWNSCGMQRSFNYDENGKWNPPLWH
jgi:hypothetical protein